MNEESQRGYMTIKRSQVFREFPVIIYRIEDGNPILDEDELIFFKSNGGKLFFSIQDNYNMFRSEILRHPYNPKKNRLTEDQFETLKSNVLSRLRKIDDKSLEGAL